MEIWLKLTLIAIAFFLLIFLFMKSLKLLFKIAVVIVGIFLLYQLYIGYLEPLVVKSCPLDCEDGNVSTVDYCSEKTNYQCMHSLGCNCEEEPCKESICSIETNFTCIYTEAEGCKT